MHGPHGLRGEMKVETLTDFPQRFQPGATLWAAGARYTVGGAHPHRDGLLVTFEGIETREQADALRGQLLEVPEGELASLGDDQYFRFQLIGMEVVDTNSRPLGRVAEVLDTGANDVYVVRDDDSELLVPAIDTVVKEVDLERRRLVVELMDGLERRPLKKEPRPR